MPQQKPLSQMWKNLQQEKLDSEAKPNTLTSIIKDTIYHHILDCMINGEDSCSLAKYTTTREGNNRMQDEIAEWLQTDHQIRTRREYYSFTSLNGFYYYHIAYW